MFCAWCGAPVATTSYAPCPRCGRPTNGAQTVPAQQGSNAAVVIILVVVGGFIAIGVVGVLAAIAIPNFLTAKQRAQQKRTMADMRSIGTAVEAYGADNGGYPDASSMEALAPLVSPKYIKALPQNDGWRHPMMYFCTARAEGRCTQYVIGSGGKDGMFEHSEPRNYLQSPHGQTDNFDCDVIFSNGQFIDYPGGSQP